MKPLVNIFQVRVGDVGVYLGGRDVAVAEQRLHGAEIGTVHKQIGGK